MLFMHARRQDSGGRQAGAHHDGAWRRHTKITLHNDKRHPRQLAPSNVAKVREAPPLYSHPRIETTMDTIKIMTVFFKKLKTIMQHSTFTRRQ